MHVGLILKVSKFCNLRCAYCCEMDQLGDRRRMSVEQVGRVFRSVRALLDEAGSGDDGLSCYWHGGEPLVQPMSYWTAVLDAQAAMLGPRLHARTVNALQSNLTLVKPAHLPLFARMRIGFSYDVLNDLRVDRAGRPTQDAVVRSVDWLVGRGIPLAGIAVVSAANVGDPAAVADFYLARRLPFRFILLDEALEHRPEIAAMRVPLTAFVGFALALWRLPRVRRALAAGLRIDPLSEVLALERACPPDAAASGDPAALARREHLLEVDTDGAVYSTADYPYRHAYGNLFTQPLAALLLSAARARRVARSERRLRALCGGCRFFGRGCTGARVSHATEPVFAEYRQAGGCELKLIADGMRAADAEQAA